MEPEPEPSAEEVVNHLRSLRDALASRRDALREEGYTVDEFVEAADRFLAALEGGGDEPVDVQGFRAKLDKFVAEVNTTQRLQAQAEAIAVVTALPGTLDEMERQAAELRKHGGRMEAQTAADLEAEVAAARARLERGEMPLDEMQGIALTMTAQRAEFKRRIEKRVAAMMLFWEKQTPEWWARRTPEELATIRNLQAQWEEHGEGLLSELPMADRRELESMTLEDFEKSPQREI